MRKLGRTKLREAKRILVGYGATDVYLFGSYAEGRARGDSDVDLAVSGLPPGRFFAAMGQVMTTLGRGVDLVDLDDRSDFSTYLRDRGELVRLV